MRRVILTVTAVAVALLGAACGPAEDSPTEPTPSATASATVEVPGTDETPAPDPSTPAPGTSPDSVPHASVNSQAGFMLSSRLTGDATIAGPVWYNSSGGQVTVTQQSTGIYLVRFQGLGTTGGVPHVESRIVGFMCNLSGFAPVGADEQITVFCYDSAGQLANSRFGVTFAVGSQAQARFTYVYAMQEKATAPYNPGAPWAYDSVDTSRVTVTRLSTGHYAVTLPAASADPNLSWEAQVTAGGGRGVCKLTRFTPATRTAEVGCYAYPSAYTPQDMRFALSFAQNGANIIGRTDRTHGAAVKWSANTTPNNDGTFTVILPGIGKVGGYASVVSVGDGDGTCGVDSWQPAPNGTDERVDVHCTGPEVDFLVTFTQ